MGTITTRAFLIEDYDKAFALWQEMAGIEICEGDSREEIRGYLERNPGLSRVAESEGEIVGAVLCGHDGRRGFIYHLGVATAFRGRGVGKQLLDDCVRGLHAAGIPRALLLVASENATGHEFWLRHGWEDIDALAMALEVSG
ncbi:MAG: GNAT family N-acetyltransferase [Chthoniobacterales bacterium]